ncbi:MAG: murein biosynthesis integral membrane protein MurJ [Anaplasma sp.]
MLRRVLTFSSFTFLSRVLGLVRDTLIAYTLGAQGLSDVFLAAFRLPNLFRAYFNEGALSASFVPIYSRRLSEQNAPSEFASQIFSALLMFLLAFCAVMLVFTPQALRIFTPGFLVSAQKFKLAVELSRIMMIYLFCMSLASVAGVVLESHSCFFVTAISPILLNCCVVISALVPHWGMPVYYFAVAVSLAGVLQLILTLCVASRKKVGVRFIMPRPDSDVRVFLKRAMISALSNCMSQISVWINVMFASFIPGAISYIYYADRLNQFPQALVGVSISTVLLPYIAKLAREGNTQRVVEMQNSALDLGMTLIVPAAAALIAIPDALLLSLLNYGQFDYWAIGNTVPVLATLAASLPSFVITKILLLFFYTRGEFKIPAVFSLISISVNVCLNFIFVKFYGHVGIAIAGSLSSWVHSLLLLVYLRVRGLYRMSTELSNKMACIFLSAAIMVVVICMAKTLLAPFFFQGPVVKISSLSIVVLLGVLVYFSALFVVFRQKLTILDVQDVAQNAHPLKSG